MIRHVQFELEDHQYQALLKAKAGDTWPRFVMLLTNEQGQRPTIIHAPFSGEIEVNNE
jgi:hypothetical protein